MSALIPRGENPEGEWRCGSKVGSGFEGEGNGPPLLIVPAIFENAGREMDVERV